MKKTSEQTIQSLALEAFSSEAYFTINKSLLIAFGPERAVFLSNLIDKLRYFLEHDLVKDGEWFYLIHEHQMEQTGIKSEKTLRKLKKEFKDNGILETKFIGQPGKEHYRIDIGVLIKAVGLDLPKGKGKPCGEGLGVTLGEGLEVPVGEGLYKDKNNKVKKNKEKHTPLPPKGSETVSEEEKPSKKKKPKKLVQLKEFQQMFPESWLKIPHFCFLLEQFFTYRQQLRKPLTEIGSERLAIKLTKSASFGQALAALERSMESGWTGVFPESVQGQNPSWPIAAIDPEEIEKEIDALRAEMAKEETPPSRQVTCQTRICNLQAQLAGGGTET